VTQEAELTYWRLGDVSGVCLRYTVGVGVRVTLRLAVRIKIKIANNTRQQNFTLFLAHEGKYQILIGLLTLNSNM